MDKPPQILTVGPEDFGLLNVPREQCAD